MLRRVFQIIKSTIALLVLGLLTKFLLSKFREGIFGVLENSLILVFVVAAWVDFFERALPIAQALIQKIFARNPHKPTKS